MTLKKQLRSLLADKRGQAEQLPQSPIDWLSQPLARFLKIEAAAGLVLLFFTLLALYLANSSFSAHFVAWWETSIGFKVGSITIEHSLHTWINDALMTLFFFLIALELKRELVLGELRKPKLAMLSVAAAIGGMLVPACIYVFLQLGEPGQHGWGTVMATDTAFVIGCLALLGKRIPKSLRVFMLSLAIVDDLGAIIVVAIGYGNTIDLLNAGLALAGFAAIKLMSLLGIRSIVLFFIAGAFLWVLVDASGIHPTVTGVVLGLMTPTTKWVSDERLHNIVNALWAHPESGHKRDHHINTKLLKTAEAAAREALSPVERLELMLHPWVGFLVMPLFAFANAGIPLSLQEMSAAISMAVFIGFVVGKPLGICLFSWLAVQCGLAERPSDLSWSLIFACGVLASIGFTMAMFIANLAFAPEHINAAKFGILSASLFSATLGIALLFMVTKKNDTQFEQRTINTDAQ
ncbi:Na+/H+ antiporter NhaA [Alteromonas aestuariivivens]|uniref:Na(+)/H(+) antiporter NhaA n=1 Tax=Alteromonas aestuariivivens TaxID=1938339 RepID=A0A3D8MEB4_9ALTE|nr:Na+/H+ antiporter NhaA [Alteromonas aestuariivivens]RDV28940.1 Na+/H+ antiporter NhaA [Alteromonas aestuariivivens]